MALELDGTDVPHNGFLRFSAGTVLLVFLLAIYGRSNSKRTVAKGTLLPFIMKALQSSIVDEFSPLYHIGGCSPCDSWSDV